MVMVTKFAIECNPLFNIESTEEKYLMSYCYARFPGSQTWGKSEITIILSEVLQFQYLNKQYMNELIVMHSEINTFSRKNINMNN
jgi:hypothetical protein